MTQENSEPPPAAASAGPACSPSFSRNDHEEFYNTEFIDMTFAMSGKARALITNQRHLTDHREWLESNDPGVYRMLCMLRSEGVLDHASQDRAMVVLLAKALHHALNR